MPDVEHGTRLHHRIGTDIRIAQELAKVGIAHGVVLNRELIFGAALVGDVVGWVGQPHVDQGPGR